MNNHNWQEVKQMDNLARIQRARPYFNSKGQFDRALINQQHEQEKTDLQSKKVN
jgi:hypothetical protein